MKNATQTIKEIEAAAHQQDKAEHEAIVQKATIDGGITSGNVERMCLLEKRMDAYKGAR